MHTSRQFETMQQVDKAGKQVTVSAHRSSHTQQEHGLHGGVTTDAYMLTDTENYCHNSARTTFSLSSTQWPQRCSLKSAPKVDNELTWHSTGNGNKCQCVCTKLFFLYVWDHIWYLARCLRMLSGIIAGVSSVVSMLWIWSNTTYSQLSLLKVTCCLNIY